MQKNKIVLKNKIASIIMITLLSISATIPVFARIAQETITVNFNNIRLTVDGRNIQTEFEPFVFEGRTYLPVRDVANAMGFGVTWEDATNTVHLTAGMANPYNFSPAIGSERQQTITVNFNNIRFAVNGQLVQTEFDPFIFQGRTYLPVRDVSIAMGFEVNWEDATNTIHLTSQNLSVTPDYTPHHQATPNYPPHQPQATPLPTSGANISIPENIIPRTPAVSGGPTSPPISAQRAVELARDHLISIGVTNARFDYVYMDREGGTWVWSVEFDGSGRSYEFYVNVETGAFLKAPQSTVTAIAPTAPVTSSRQGGRPSNPAISLQRAIEIAEADLLARGIAATFHSDSGMDWERGQWVWELEFRVTNAPRGRHVIEYYINVDTGAIVKFEQGD